MPARCTRRVPCSMKNSTYIRRRNTVSTWKKSGGQDRLRLAGQQRPPAMPRPPGCGIDARVLQDLPHRRRRNFIVQAGQLTVDPAISPGRVVPCHLQYQRAHGLRCARPPGSAARVCAALLDQVGVPAQQGARADDQAQAAEVAAGQQPGQRGQDRAISPGQPRGFDLALEHGDLVAQDQDLGVLGAVGTGEQGEPAEYPEHRKVSGS